MQQINRKINIKSFYITRDKTFNKQQKSHFTGKKK